MTTKPVLLSSMALCLLAATSPTSADSCMVSVTDAELVTERYGINADLRKGRTHDGFDFRAPLGAPLRAGADGVVSMRNTMKGAGNVLTIRRQNGDTLMYYHLSAYASGVEVGKPVKAGQVIGYAGGTSAKVTGSPAYASYAPHLHFIYGVPNAGQARQTNFSEHASRLRSVNPAQLPHEFNTQAQPAMAAVGFKTDPAPFFCEAYPFKDKRLDAILGRDTKEQHRIIFGSVPPGGSPPEGAYAPVEAAAGNAQLILAQQAGKPIEEFLSDSDGYGALPGPSVGAYEAMSANEMMATEAVRRFQSADWANELTKVSSRALWVDYARANGVSIFLADAIRRKKQHVEALLAVYTSQKLASQRQQTEQARRRAVAQQAVREVQ
ncbi:M23 family metallopeptidase [Xanthomonas euvesicatoria]|uniref:M23 family metallopeptidase n=1 Tax=Xanthomonas euvesicatoria TaxID=456327 RepID=UPI003D2F8E31